MRMPVDPGNVLLAQTRSCMDTSVMQTAGGQRLAVTIRTSSATLTVMLTKAEAAEWGTMLVGDAAQMSGSGLITGGNIPA